MLIICTICFPDRSVWVSDSQQPFVEHPTMSPDVLYMKERQPLVIPCRVTHPNVTTTLVKVSAERRNDQSSMHVVNVSTHLLYITLTFSNQSHHSHSLHLITCPTQFFPSVAHICTQCTVPLFLLLWIIRHIVLILAAITLWRVCPFVCVRLRICVKVCADVFVSVGA